MGISSDTGTLRAVDLSAGGGGAWGGAAEIRSEDEEVAWGPSARRGGRGGWGGGGAGYGAAAEGVIELQPDGNSFDMLKNLIKIKE